MGMCLCLVLVASRLVVFGFQTSAIHDGSCYFGCGLAVFCFVVLV
jgi:hypothetical protein